MNKKLIIGIVAIIVILLAVVFLVKRENIKEDNNDTNKPSSEIKDNSETGNDIENITSGKTLVVYFSATGSTKKVAEEISKNLNADIFEIVPTNGYTQSDLDWTNSNSRVSREHNDTSLRNVELKSTKVDNWDEYDTILIGYPIWWGIAAWPVNTFVKANDFGNKIVIPFCTSASSGLGQSGTLLEQDAKGGVWKNGHRFSSSASTQDIKNWTDSLNK